MDDLEHLILTTWRHLHPHLAKNPDELGRRLARRRSPFLASPPRPWCLAVRASDTRINLTTPIISPHPPPPGVPPPPPPTPASPPPPPSPPPSVPSGTTKRAAKKTPPPTTSSSTTT